MKTIRNGAEAGSKVKAVLLDGKSKLKDLNDREQKYADRFLKSKKDFERVDDLDFVIYFILTDKNSETMRRRGAELASKIEIDKDLKSIHLFGKGNQFDLLEGFLLALYKYQRFFTKDKKENAFEAIYTNELNKDQIEELLTIRDAVFWTRDRVNDPVSHLNALAFAQEISRFVNLTDVQVTVLEKTQIESLKMGGLLAVNQGSVDPPSFAILEYKPKKAANKKPIVLVGKGVVYDTGGLSLKPTLNSMDSMKSDMAGAASVVGAFYLAAKRKVPVHIVALIPATDNRPGFNAYAPGDVVTMFNGMTVEVLNTDAEGRMILADALSYADKFKPELVVDAATLTGAAHRAIGEHAALIMGNAKEHYFSLLEKAGEKSFERVVKMPFWEEYLEEMKSTIADLKNVGGGTAGMISAGKFLEQFTKSPYIHMDIAGPSWLSKTTAYRPKGGSGYGTRLIYQFIKDYSDGGN